jgi:DNA-binding phage protein
MRMDANDVRKLIRDDIKQIGITAFAKKAGVTRAQIYAVLNGQREPRGRILDVLGLEKFIGFRRKKPAHGLEGAQQRTPPQIYSDKP